ncbi:MAG: 50S ribosomal protein L9 [Velocimicrobium sp.]
MDVILLEDVKTLGKKGDMVHVNDGYARNFILPKKLGMEATARNLNDLKLKKANEQRLEQEKLEEAKDFAAKLATKKVELFIKAGKDGRSFGSISTKEIAEAAKEQLGYTMDKKKMQLSAPIKSAGSFTVLIKIHPKVTAELNVHVAEQ